MTPNSSLNHDRLFTHSTMTANPSTSRRGLPSVLSITTTSSSISLHGPLCEPNITIPACNHSLDLLCVPSITMPLVPRSRATETHTPGHFTPSRPFQICVLRTASPTFLVRASKAYGSRWPPTRLHRDSQASVLHLPSKATTPRVMGRLLLRPHPGTDRILRPSRRLHLPPSPVARYTLPMTGLARGVQGGEEPQDRIHRAQHDPLHELRAQPRRLATVTVLRG
jgi:hypothetical protein